MVFEMYDSNEGKIYWNECNTWLKVSVKTTFIIFHFSQFSICLTDTHIAYDAICLSVDNVARLGSKSSTKNKAELTASDIQLV